jgi:hypothetical protein
MWGNIWGSDDLLLLQILGSIFFAISYPEEVEFKKTGL